MRKYMCALKLLYSRDYVKLKTDCLISVQIQNESTHFENGKAKTRPNYNYGNIPTFKYTTLVLIFEHTRRLFYLFKTLFQHVDPINLS